MVDLLSMFFMVVSAIIAFLFPLGLAFYYYKKQGISIPAVLVGSLMFFIFQVIIRIPLLSILSTQKWYSEFSKNILLFSLFLGLTAGLFETAGRFLGLRFMLRKQLEWKNGVAYGIGHGGFEAMVLLGTTCINNLTFSFLINTKAFESTLGTVLPPETLSALKSTLIDTPPYMFLMGGLERVFTMAIQIALSLVVLYAIMNKKYIYLLYAVLLHTLADAPAAAMSLWKVNVFVSEAYVLLLAIAAMMFIGKSKKWLKKQPEPPKKDNGDEQNKLLIE